VTYVQEFNPENRLSLVKRVSGPCGTPGTIDEQWVFTYDGDWTRVSQMHSFGTTVTTTRYYFGGEYETSDNPSAAKKYYSFAGQTIVMDDGSGLKNFLSDHLGSMSAVLDDNGK
jgi:hypothetical protein